MVKRIILGILLIIVATAIHFDYELGFWLDWVNDIKIGKGALWLYRMINVVASSIGIALIISGVRCDKCKFIAICRGAGIFVSSVILAFAWALLVVAVVGAITLPVMVLEGVGGAAVLLIILYFIGRRGLNKQK